MFVPGVSEELHLLMRGRLPEYLQYVEAFSGVGAEKGVGGNWQRFGEILSPKLEEIAQKVPSRKPISRTRLVLGVIS